MGQKGCRYTDKEKLRLVEEFKNYEGTQKSFTELYGLGHSTISNWMTKFGLALEKKVVRMSTKEKKNNPSRLQSTEEKILEARIKQLEQELKDEKIKSLAYKTMIEIAEEELGVDISKKAGAKR